MSSWVQRYKMCNELVYRNISPKDLWFNLIYILGNTLHKRFKLFTVYHILIRSDEIVIAEFQKVYRILASIKPLFEMV